MIRRTKTEEASINLTPMIDVVFLLVIFFLVGSKYESASQQVDVNVAAGGDMQSMARQPDKRIVAVAADGSVILDGSYVSLEQLTNTLSQQRQSFPGLRVSVQSDDQSSFTRVYQVMQQIRRTGVSEIDVSQSRTRIATQSEAASRMR